MSFDSMTRKASSKCGVHELGVKHFVMIKGFEGENH
jgi:hypothetical protein